MALVTAGGQFHPNFEPILKKRKLRINYKLVIISVLIYIDKYSAILLKA